jgi:hypothetical protein
VPNLFIGERDQATIWRAPSPKRIGGGSKEYKEDHPTQKPVVLSEIPIRNHLRPGEAVYEPFAGSGTTLMAAETLGRRCYAMEIDPKYVQVAIERWLWRRHGGADKSQVSGAEHDRRGTWGRGPPAVAAVRRGTRRCPRARRSRNRGRGPEGNGRGERDSPSLTQRSLSFLMVNATPRPPVPLELVRSA